MVYMCIYIYLYNNADMIFPVYSMIIKSRWLFLQTRSKKVVVRFGMLKILLQLYLYNTCIYNYSTGRHLLVLSKKILPVTYLFYWMIYFKLSFQMESLVFLHFMSLESLADTQVTFAMGLRLSSCIMVLFLKNHWASLNSI